MVWTRLDKRGNSHTLERMQLFSRFLEHFAHVKVSYLTADRELVGQDCLAISIAPNTPFRLRIRENHQLFDGKHSLKVSTLFQNLEATQQQVLRHQRCLWGHWLYIAALRLDHGTLLVVATQRTPTRRSWPITLMVGKWRLL